MADPAAITLEVERAFREHFEVEPQRASVSFVGVAPIEILRYADDESAHYATLGMSSFPLVEPSELSIDPATAPRAELLLTVHRAPDAVWKSLAILAAAPAVEGAVYRLGGRVDLTEPLVPGSRCTGGLLVPSPLAPVVVSGFSEVEILQLLPATATELAWARIHGSEALIERWREADTPLTDLTRQAVDLA